MYVNTYRRMGLVRKFVFFKTKQKINQNLENIVIFFVRRNAFENIIILFEFGNERFEIDPNDAVRVPRNNVILPRRTDGETDDE